jgi:hypothetical protein
MNTRKAFAKFRDTLVLIGNSEVIELLEDTEIYRPIASISDAWCYCPAISSGSNIYLLSSPGIFKVNVLTAQVTQILDLANS